MKSISKLILENFKFFYQKNILNFENRNILIYGENGSGKSSIYWALYTLLQSSIKKTHDEKTRILKYFDKDDQDSLVNKYIEVGEDSHITIELNDDTLYRVAQTDTNTNLDEDTTIYESYTTSDFINYKLLAKNFDFKHSKVFDIFEFLENEILNDLLIKDKSKTFGKWLKQLRYGYMLTRQDNQYSSSSDLNRDLESFISELDEFLASITQNINDILEKYFELDFEVSFEVENLGISKDTRIIKPDGVEKRYTIHSIYQPIVNMNLKNSDESYIHKPHTFLNEAKQTAIALAIRFAILKSKATSVDTLKILVLDDLLLSLDMSNRDIVLNLLIKDEYFEDYQIIMLTHDKYFYQLAKYKFEYEDKGKWKFFEMYEREDNNVLYPYVEQESLTYLEKAEKYYYLNEYDIAGNFLRKEAENFCKKFLPKKYHFGEELNLKELNGLISESLNFVRNSGLDDTLFKELDSYRKFVLNPTSHDSYDVPKFKKEVKECIETLKKLNHIHNEQFLSKGAELEFELVTADGNDTYKFEIKLEEEFRLLKIEDTDDNLISKGMLNYWVQKNGSYICSRQTITNKECATQHCKTTLKEFYDKNYEQSDKTKNPDFWEEIVIKSTGEKILSFK